MKKPGNHLGSVWALIALLLFPSVAQAKKEVRIDGSSDKSVEQSFARMNQSLNNDQKVELMTAIIQLNMIGISSAKEMLADPELRNPGPVRIKSRIAGLTAAEIIELAKETATTRIVVPSQEPGVPADLLTALDPGKPVYLLESTQWRYESNVNGFIEEQTLKFAGDRKLETEPASTAGTSSWEQSSDEVRIFINDRYSVSRGKFVDADHMKGTGGNKVGSTWTWSAERL